MRVRYGRHQHVRAFNVTRIARMYYACVHVHRYHTHVYTLILILREILLTYSSRRLLLLIMLCSGP